MLSQKIHLLDLLTRTLKQRPFLTTIKYKIGISNIAVMISYNS